MYWDTERGKLSIQGYNLMKRINCEVETGLGNLTKFKHLTVIELDVICNIFNNELETKHLVTQLIKTQTNSVVISFSWVTDNGQVIRQFIVDIGNWNVYGGKILRLLDCILRSMYGSDLLSCDTIRREFNKFDSGLNIMEVEV